MHRLELLRPLATLALAALLSQACGSPTTRSASSPTTPAPSAASLPGASEDAVTSHPLAPTPQLQGGPSLPGPSYVDMPISLEMTVGCGHCGPAWWLFELPRFRLYADGTAVFRGVGDPTTAPYRFLQLGDKDFEDLLAYALDDGGLRGAEPRYLGDSDDTGSIRLALHAVFFDEAANVDVESCIRRSSMSLRRCSMPSQVGSSSRSPVAWITPTRGSAPPSVPTPRLRHLSGSSAGCGL